MLVPATGKRFRDYAIHTLVPYIKNISSNVNRVDIVWDRYFEDSLKSCTRGQRGAGIRRNSPVTEFFLVTGQHFFNAVKTKQSFSHSYQTWLY